MDQISDANEYGVALMRSGDMYLSYDLSNAFLEKLIELKL